MPSGRDATRRSVLIGAAALLGTARAARSADINVVVVGAGAAGIAAARRLRALGRSAIVLEARGRIGGRVATDSRFGVPFDTGAQYIHWAERNPWTRIAADLGIPTPADDGGNPPLVYANGLVIPDGERGRRRRAFLRIDALVAGGTRPDRSIADAVRGEGDDVLAAARGLTLLTLGEEPERVSAADYDALWSGDDLIPRGGYGALVAAHGQGLDIRLNAPVRSIDWSGPGVRIGTDEGAVTARAAIVTVSPGILQADAIAFGPGLPHPVRDAVDGLRMGAYTKIALRLDRARLGPPTLADAIDQETPHATTSFEIWPGGSDLIVAYCGGDFARELCEAGERAAVDHATERLAAIGGPAVRGAVVAGMLANWWTDPYSRGSYSIARPGRLAARDALRVPVGERVWFAGEASAGGGAMTAGGAYLEGVRAAEAVHRAVP